jgi:hypothetical protein
MSRLSRSRAVVATGLTLGTATAGLLFAPAALAAETLPALNLSPSTVTEGASTLVSGKGCVAFSEADVVEAVAFLDADLNAEADPVGKPAEVDEAGDWSVSLELPAGSAGEHQVYAFCGHYVDSEDPEAWKVDDYPIATLTVVKPTAGTGTTTTTGGTTTGGTLASTGGAAAEGEIRGAAANSAGVAATTSSKNTTATPAPGKKVVKVYKGFQPGEKVTLTMHSTPATFGPFTADANGEVTVEFTVPAGAEAGTHTLVLNGDAGTYFQETITVAAGTGLAETSSSSLAYTGADVALPLALGAGLLALGGGALVVSRRRAGATQA